MGCNTSLVVANLFVLFCFIQISRQCNIRELNNVIEDHFKKELQLKKCATIGQKCQLDKDCCKNLLCEMSVSDDGIVNVCRQKDILQDDISNSGMNQADYQEKNQDVDGNMDWMHNNDDDPPDIAGKREIGSSGNESDSDYNYESENLSRHDVKENRDTKERRKQQLIRENEELEKLFTEKEEREIEQLKALKEDAEIDELRKLRELKIKRKLQLLKELHELRSLKAKDDFQQILEIKEKKKSGVNETTDEQFENNQKVTNEEDKHDGKDDLDAHKVKINGTYEENYNTEQENEEVPESVTNDTSAVQGRIKDENDDVQDQTQERGGGGNNTDAYSNGEEKLEGSENGEVEGENEEASGNGERENKEESSRNVNEGSGKVVETTGDGEPGAENEEFSGNGEENKEEASGDNEGSGEASGDAEGTPENNEEATGNGEATEGNNETEANGETRNGNETEATTANDTTTLTTGLT